MTHTPVFIGPEESLIKAAEQMKAKNCGVLPVGNAKGIEGVITDRDIVVRAVAKGKDPTSEKVKNYMSKHVYSCFETDTLQKAAEEMRKHKVSRLLVKDQAGAVTGILSFGHILRNGSSASEVSRVVELAVGRNAA
ncbi:MAG: signal transduction protein [Sneathiella sp.]|nr:signal transduction protein [Sneathiella sp.]